MSPHAATYREALEALDFYLGWHGGWMPVDRRTEAGDRRWYHRCGTTGSGRLLADTVSELAEADTAPDVLLGCPEIRRFRGAAGASALWCYVTGTEQVRHAHRFRPLPTLVLREGTSSRRLLLWALRSWLPYYDVQDANRRIAYRLRAVQRLGDPEQLWIPAPGTCLRIGRQRPVPVRVARLTLDTFTVGQVVGRLKAPPEPQWNTRAA